MNEFEELYAIRLEIESKIKKHKLFSLSRKSATLKIFEKMGSLISLLATAESDKKINIYKEYVGTDSNSINEESVIQESMKWMLRWCGDYCSEFDEINEKEIKVNDIIELMGVAYSYEELDKVLFLHSKNKVSYKRINGILKFDYKEPEKYAYHLLYDLVIRKQREAKYPEIVASLDNLKEGLNEIHWSMFEYPDDMNFGNFTLGEYKLFSSALNDYLIEHMSRNMFSNAIVLLADREGFVINSISEWIELLADKTGLSANKTEDIINFLTLDLSDKGADVSISYFVKVDEINLAISEVIFLLSNIEANALRLLSKVNRGIYDKEQNRFEDLERSKIGKLLDNRFEISYGKHISEKIRPGMDLLVYDESVNELQVIELKYKIPIESVKDFIRLDELLDKGLLQIGKAKNYCEGCESTLLEEYFGKVYSGITPNKIDYFLLTNYSVGMGGNFTLPSPVLITDHYIDVMNRGGINLIRAVLGDNGKGVPSICETMDSNYQIAGYKFAIQDFQFRLVNLYSEL
ncbi:hypothetical protein [Listeria booriae]|uniref:hypothetical protein n=1 Tax=Listeria booriae TaxID=1552123 RepID=UPI00162946F7|nr:hypothetical protein [Listeria booriae]MBC1235173.1 hypothetical protein [Listeria booriae]